MVIKEIVNRKKLVYLILVIVLATGMIVLTGCDKSNNNIKTYEKESDEITNQLKNESNNFETKELTDIEKQLLFDKTITSDKTFIQEMVIVKDFSSTEFKDEEIIKLLPILDNFYHYNVLETQGEGSFAQINTSDIQKLSSKYFGKSIDTNNIKEYIENDIVTVELETGYGIVKYEMVSVSQKSNNEYSVKFKYIEDDKISIYNINVLYENGNVIYKTIERESSSTNDNVDRYVK